MKLNNFFKLVIAIAVSELAGVIGSVFTVSAIPDPSTGSGQAWYAGLIKPALNPPSWVFAPVWTTLYALMGIALFLVWSSYTKASADKKQHSNILENVGMLRMWKIGIAAFFVQLSLNAVWSIIFFGLHSPGWALVDIVLLWLAIVWTIAVFYKISPPSHKATEGQGHPSPRHGGATEGHGKLAAYLLVPYLLWVSFAAYLNYSIWILN